MRIIKAGLQGLRKAELVDKSAHVEAQMAGNANFATPTPSLVEVAAARAALTAALTAAEGGGHAAIATKNAAAKKLSSLLVSLARYVNSVTGGDIEKAVSSGFELAKTADPVDKLEAPSNFAAKRGTIAGQVDLRWKGVRGGRMYEVYICDGDPTTTGVWTAAGMTSKSRFTVKGLTRNKAYSFRTAALGVVGQGPMSEIVSAEAA